MITVTRLLNKAIHFLKPELEGDCVALNQELIRPYEFLLE